MTAAPMPSWAGESTNWSGEWGGGIWVASAYSEFPETAAEAVVFLATDPDMREDKVTFPGYQPAFEKWRERLALIPITRLTRQWPWWSRQAKIRQDNNPVRYDMQGQFGLLNGGINGGSSMRSQCAHIIDALTNLAPAAGYTVSE